MFVFVSVAVDVDMLMLLDWTEPMLSTVVLGNPGCDTVEWRDAYARPVIVRALLSGYPRFTRHDARMHALARDGRRVDKSNGVRASERAVETVTSRSSKDGEGTGRVAKKGNK